MKITGLLLALVMLVGSLCAQESAPPAAEAQSQQQQPAPEQQAPPAPPMSEEPAAAPAAAEQQAPATQPAPEQQTPPAEQSAPAEQPPAEQPPVEQPAPPPAAQPPAEEQAPPAPPESLRESVQEPLPPPPVQPQVARTNIYDKVPGPTDPELYCAGFITNQDVPDDQYVAAGWGSPHQSKFNDREYVYLAGGGFQQGGTYEIVRKLQDPNRWEVFRGQRRAVGRLGQPYAQIGHVEVISVRENTAITRVLFSCEPVVPGDIAVPFVERPRPIFKPDPKFDRFAPPNGKLTGRIVLSRDFDSFLGHSRIAYLNVGAEEGVKVGDYFHATRTYDSSLSEEIDAISAKASFVEDTQKNPRRFPNRRYDELPRRTLGTMVVLNVSPRSSTGLITFALEDVMVGDDVEMFDPPMPAPTVAQAMNPPLITCTANPATVRVGESSVIICDVSSPDDRPMSLSFSTSGGQLAPRNNRATLDTTQLQPGTVTVTGTVTDDRNLSASSPVTVNVEAPSAIPTPTTQDIAFNPANARVDNRAKAILDGVALQLQQQADATAIVTGYADTSEAGGEALATRRAANVRAYLLEKGIDSNRITTRAVVEAGKSGVVVTVVPAGATPPQ
jgi:outer membrane protein OmpA-like peptidoglycan-associated protein